MKPVTMTLYDITCEVVEAQRAALSVSEPHVRAFIQILNDKIEKSPTGSDTSGWIYLRDSLQNLADYQDSVNRNTASAQRNGVTTPTADRNISVEEFKARLDVSGTGPNHKQ